MEGHNLGRQPWAGRSFFGFILALLATTLACSLINIPDDSQANIEATIAAAIEGTRQAEIILQTTIEAAVVATQQAQAAAGSGGATTAATDAGDNSVSATPTAAAIIANPNTLLIDQRDVTGVIASEVNGIINQDLGRLQGLYAPDAIVIDRGGTLNNLDDDRLWNGWSNIAARFEALFEYQVSALTLVDLTVQVDELRATGRYNGLIVNEGYYADKGMYTLEQRNGQWLITQVEFGVEPNYAFQLVQDDGLYILEVGSQHRYEEPWGWDRGDPCRAWQDKNFDDTQPNYRGFNIELLLTNNSQEQAPHEWPIRFTTASGKAVKACQYSYEGAGPPPGATNSATFFTVVEKGDYVEKIALALNDQVINLCLDGKGGWWRCESGR